MIQNALKVLTLGFFFSTITGFVLYRMGYFEADKTLYSLQSSPNGGELLNATVDQDTNRSPEINQSIETPILPSSKSGRIFDLKVYEQQKELEIMPSTKSGLHPIRINPDVEEVKLENPYVHSSKSMIHLIEFPKPEKVWTEADLKVKEMESKKEPISDSNGTDKDTLQKLIEIKGAKRVAETSTRSIRISLSTIGLGVLGILFVVIGSIIYFKRKTK